MVVKLMKNKDCEINVITFVKSINQIDDNEYNVEYIDGVKANFKNVQILSVKNK